jgi:uncharacterized membrane protein YraQ (UPF0718 family)
MKIRNIFYLIFLVFMVISKLLHFESGETITANFITFAVSLIKIVPVVFILIGLFEVWVKRETIERHLGEDSSWLAFLWAILLSSTTVGGLYVAFPIAAALHSKGAKLSVIFTYVGAAAVCRVPMITFEATFMGIKFTIIRLLVSLPLIILSSIILGRFLSRKKFVIHGG